eukprot:scaffold2008_cov283-Pinguiococcus_pyrenoidosus.AAC.16
MQETRNQNAKLRNLKFPMWTKALFSGNKGGHGFLRVHHVRRRGFKICLVPPSIGRRGAGKAVCNLQSARCLSQQPLLSVAVQQPRLPVGTAAPAAAEASLPPCTEGVEGECGSRADCAGAVSYRPPESSQNPRDDTRSLRTHAFDHVRRRAGLPGRLG